MLKKLFIKLIRLYQILISPLIGGKNKCRFIPTCSQYTIDAIEEHGIIKGSCLSIKRILRCNPFTKIKDTYDPVPLKRANNKKGK